MALSVPDWVGTGQRNAGLPPKTAVDTHLTKSYVKVDELVALLQRKNRLAFWRKVRGFTQEEIALWVGVSRGTISNWELDICEPNPDQAKIMATLLGVSVRQLFPYTLY